MRRMYSQNQLEDIIKTEVESGNLENAKPVYWHSIKFVRQGAGAYYFEGYLVIIDNDNEAITLTKFIDEIKKSGFVGVVFNGLTERSGGATAPSSNSLPVILLENSGETYVKVSYRDSSNAIQSDTLSINPDQWTITDLGFNKLN